MTDLIRKNIPLFKEQLPGRVSRPGNDSYVAATAIWARRVGRALRAVVHCQHLKTSRERNGNGNRSMPTNLKIVSRLLSFAAAAFVLLAVVNADARQPTTSSVVIPLIPPGQARIWVCSGSQPVPPNFYPHVEAVTFNGVNVGYEQLGGVSTARLHPGITSLVPPAWHLIPTSP
jgi:hypothetical protein